jgi:tripartite ATP-independent transporter DctM subunit
MGMAERLKITAEGGFALAAGGDHRRHEVRHLHAHRGGRGRGGVRCAVGMFIYRELKWSALYQLVLSAGKTTAVVMFLVAAAMVSAWLITVANIPTEVANMLEPFMGNKILLMFVMMVLIVIVGTALDFTPTVLILTPVLMPVVLKAGIDPVYFGVLFIMNNAIGLITPPVGTVLNVVCGVAKITMDEAFKGVMPFFLAQLAVLFLLVFFPEIVLVPLKWWMA